MHGCACVCMHVCVCVCMCVCVCAVLYMQSVSPRSHLCPVWLHVCMYACTCRLSLCAKPGGTDICTHVCACVCVCVPLGMCIYIYIYVYTHIHRYSCMCMCMNARVCNAINAYLCVRVAPDSFIHMLTCMSKINTRP